MAGGTVFGTVREKHEYIRERRTKRYREVLRMPEWTPDELVEMGYSMRAAIKAQLRAREIVKSQLSWDPLAADTRK